MIHPLSALEIRILGSLIEKKMATPDYYPMTLNSLTQACNQKTARDPVTDYEPEQINAGLDTLRDKGWVLRVDTAGSRTAKFRHQAEAIAEFHAPHLAVLCLLFLRGPQTLGEIRTRSERLHLFPDLTAVEDTMLELIQWTEPCAFAVELPRQPGQKEKRYSHLLADSTPQTPLPTSQPIIATTEIATTVPPGNLDEAILELRAESESLREELQALKQEFIELKNCLRNTR